MRILSHRGYWQTPEEKNTKTAFSRSFHLGFGTETDVRDLSGDLVISHDPPNDQAMPFRDFLALYKQQGPELPLALNIKADGLQTMLQNALREFEVTDYFVFDMSIPDTLGYLDRAMPVYARQSEYEPQPAFYDRADGIWLDCFRSEWMQADDVRAHLRQGKQVCLVSPDLHKRPHLPFWEALLAWDLHEEERLALCTDFPEEARNHFYG